MLLQIFGLGCNYLSGSEFLVYNAKRRESQLGFFQNYFKDDSLKEDYRIYALNTIEYGIVVDKLMYLWKKRMKSETVLNDTEFFGFEKKSFLENPNGYSCPSYIRFLNLFIKDKYERSVFNNLTNEGGDKKHIPAVEKFMIAEQLLSKPYSDAVIYNIIKMDIHGVSGNYSFYPSANLPLDSLKIYFRKKYLL